MYAILNSIYLFRRNTQFDPVSQKAVWPSTGNYCRGGAYVSALLACESIAILPEEMSKERFEWLSNLAGDVIGYPQYNCKLLCTTPAPGAGEISL